MAKDKYDECMDFLHAGNWKLIKDSHMEYEVITWALMNMKFNPSMSPVEALK